MTFLHLHSTKRLEQESQQLFLGKKNCTQEGQEAEVHNKADKAKQSLDLL